MGRKGGRASPSPWQRQGVHGAGLAGRRRGVAARGTPRRATRGGGAQPGRGVGARNVRPSDAGRQRRSATAGGSVAASELRRPGFTSASPTRRALSGGHREARSRIAHAAALLEKHLGACAPRRTRFGMRRVAGTNQGSSRHHGNARRYPRNYECEYESSAAGRRGCNEPDPTRPDPRCLAPCQVSTACSPPTSSRFPNRGRPTCYTVQAGLVAGCRGVTPSCIHVAVGATCRLPR